MFAPNGDFHLAPPGGWQDLAELWRHTVLRRLHGAGALAVWQIAKLKNWRHRGFSVDAGEAPLAANDAAGRRRLAEYLLRAPFSLEKITYNAESGSVLYRSERHWRTKRNFEVFSAPQFIAALLDQIPSKGVPQVRYYGWYSNKSRGLRQRIAGAAPGQTHAPPGLPYPQPRGEPIRFRAEVMEPGESFDQTGFELPPPPQVAPADAGQGELFGDDYARPDAADREPVFWTAEGGQDFADDDGVQPDAPE